MVISPNNYFDNCPTLVLSNVGRFFGLLSVKFYGTWTKLHNFAKPIMGLNYVTKLLKLKPILELNCCHILNM
jgi:hypothetical protein